MTEDHLDRSADSAPTFVGQTGGAVIVTLTRAAASRGVSERTVRRWIAKGKLPSGWSATDTPTGLAVTVSDARTLEPLTRKDMSMAVADRADTAPTDADALRARLADLQAQLEASQEREQWLRGRLDAADAEREEAARERQELLSRIPRALPPARSWWARWMTRERRADGDG